MPADGTVSVRSKRARGEHSSHGGFGSNRPERPMAELVTRKLRPGDIYTHAYSGLRNELDESGA